MREIDLFYQNLEEPYNSCFMALKSIILAFDNRITEEWKYKLPFFYFNGKMFCYLWIDKENKQPYVSFADGFRMNHPLLESGDRKRFKIFYVDPNKDIDIKSLIELMEEAKPFHL